MEELLQNEKLLKRHISARLRKQTTGIRFPMGREKNEKAAAVLFLMGMQRPDPSRSPEACLIFNQRSRHVRQPGDLCFPGGGLAPFLDGFLAGLLKLPGLPLDFWSLRNRRHRIRPSTLPGMSRMLATGLRESFEEMRLNPFRIHFLGPMTPEYFKRFDRIIYPMVVWTSGQKRFVPNWEVERIVPIPLRRFFDPSAYGRLSPTPFKRNENQVNEAFPEAFPCLTYESGEGREILWGLTYRIVTRLLDIVFDLRPANTASLPMLSTEKRK